MSDTVLIEEEKDIEHIAARKVAVIRKKMMAAFCVMAGIAILIVAVTTGFYELKFRALAAGLYNIDEKSGEYLIDMMFYNRYSLSDVSKYKSVVMQCGYTENGSSYMYFRSGQWIIAVTGIIIIAVVMTACIRMIVKIGHNDIYSYVINLGAENQQLKKKQKADERFLVERNEKLQNFTENIAHQIKTPLSVITMKLEMIQELCGINEDICRLITDCTKNTFKIKMFIKKLLDISRIESGKITLSSDEIVIDYIVEESVECSVDDKQKVSVNYGNEDRHRKMYADEGWLLEALINVISNCYEHINQKKGGMVYIDISSNSEVCMITISDNGDGIQDCDVAGIFDRFMSRKSQDEFHAGIGLNLSKLIIEAHHGNIRAGNSDKYGGAQFKIILPLYKFKGKL